MVLPDCLASATFGQLLELAGLLPDAIVLHAEVATSSSFRDAKAGTLETPVSVCQCRFFYSDLPTPSRVSIRSRNIKSNWNGLIVSVASTVTANCKCNLE